MSDGQGLLLPKASQCRRCSLYLQQCSYQLYLYQYLCQYLYELYLYELYLYQYLYELYLQHYLYHLYLCNLYLYSFLYISELQAFAAQGLRCILKSKAVADRFCQENESLRKSTQLLTGLAKRKSRFYQKTMKSSDLYLVS